MVTSSCHLLLQESLPKIFICLAIRNTLVTAYFLCVSSSVTPFSATYLVLLSWVLGAGKRVGGGWRVTGATMRRQHFISIEAISSCYHPPTPYLVIHPLFFAPFFFQKRKKLLPSVLCRFCNWVEKAFFDVISLSHVSSPLLSHCTVKSWINFIDFIILLFHFFKFIVLYFFRHAHGNLLWIWCVYGL